MSTEKTAIFIDGLNLYHTVKSLGFDVDFKKLLIELGTLGNLLRTKYYTCIDDDDDDSPVVPLIDWLSYNGYSVVAKSVRSFTDADGRSRIKGRIDVELTVDMIELAPHVDHIFLISGNGDFSAAIRAVQRQGKKCTVVSSVASNPPMCSDDLRRAADEFIDIAKLRSKISRENSPR
jgi:uncharacterized LabA/DUF88 family protein